MTQTATSSIGFQNKYTSTLSASISASDTTISLVSVPTPTEGFLVIEPDSSTNYEIIYYTSKTGSAVICPSAAAGRGQDDSTAASHTSGSVVRMDTTAGMFEVLQNGTALTWASPSSWTSYTPTFANFTIGNGTVSARYTQIGKIIHATGKVTLSTTSTMGTQPNMTLPVTSNSGYTVGKNVLGWGDDGFTGTADYSIVWSWNSITTAMMFIYNVAGTYPTLANITSTVPQTWASTHLFTWDIYYEAA